MLSYKCRAIRQVDDVNRSFAATCRIDPSTYGADGLKWNKRREIGERTKTCPVCWQWSENEERDGTHPKIRAN